MLNKKHILIISALAACCFMSACVTQAVTAPVQVASQGAQTTGQAAGQAAQTVTPDGDEASLNTSSTVYQSSAYSNVAISNEMTVEAASAKKIQRNNP